MQNEINRINIKNKRRNLFICIQYSGIRFKKDEGSKYKIKRDNITY